MGDVKLLYEILAGIYLTITGAVQKIGFKKRLSKGLGREVSDHDLLSISSWMRIPAEEQPPSGNLKRVRKADRVPGQFGN
jgi:hypothetical protein